MGMGYHTCVLTRCGHEDGDNEQQAVLKCSSPISHIYRLWEAEMHATVLWSSC